VLQLDAIMLIPTTSKH